LTRPFGRFIFRAIFSLREILQSQQNNCNA